MGEPRASQGLLIAGHPSRVVSGASPRDQLALLLGQWIGANGGNTPPAAQDRVERREIECLTGLCKGLLELGFELLALRRRALGQRGANRCRSVPTSSSWS